MPALCVWAPEDGVLGAVAPVALAAAAGTALVVDLDPHGPRYPGSLSLAELVDRGPRRDELTAARTGVAVLRNGGVEPEEASRVLEALADGWPHLVLRVPPRPVPGRLPAPLVPVRPLLPGCLRPDGETAVWQRTGYPVRPPGPGPVLPVPRPAVLGSLLEGRLPVPDGWVRAWSGVWRWPWS